VRLEKIPAPISKPAVAAPTRAAPSSSTSPARDRIPIRSTKRAMPKGPSRVIWVRLVWYGPKDTQIRDARGQSAPGGMIPAQWRVFRFLASAAIAFVIQMDGS
jgi:hypothetical protein